MNDCIITLETLLKDNPDLTIELRRLLPIVKENAACYKCPDVKNCTLDYVEYMYRVREASTDVLPTKEVQLKQDLFGGFDETMFKKLKNYM